MTCNRDLLGQDKDVKEHQGNYGAFTTFLTYMYKMRLKRVVKVYKKEIEVAEEKISQVIEKKKEIVKRGPIL